MTPNISSLESTEKMAEDGLISNNSEQRLMAASAPPGAEVRRPPISRIQIFTVIILCYVNLINYMDRYTIAGILPDIQDAFEITNSQAGLLQTVFVLVYMVVAPIYGYLGDRFNRRYLMSFGVFFWSLTTLVGSFMPNYASFTVFRCLVGVGEASYSTIAPTIISDMFVQDQRSKMLAFFYFAIPVGSGLGYMIGAEVTNIAKSVGADELFAWRWGLRVTPIMGFIAVLLILFVMQEPPRGEVEGGEHLKPTHFVGDLKDLATNKSYVFSTIAFTCVTFVAGALAWWGPLFVEAGVDVQEHPDVNVNGVAFVFGAIAMVAGLVGVPLGSYGGQYLRKRVPYGDPLVCGLGIVICIPLLLSGMYMAEYDTQAAYAIVFFGQVFLNLNWAVISDIVLYVVIPTRRSSAEAFQILFSHAFGDAGSPYVVGLIADVLKPYYLNQSNVVTTESSSIAQHLLLLSANVTTTASPDADDKYASFKALQMSFYLTTLVLILGAVFFFISCCFIENDKERTDRTIAESSAKTFTDASLVSMESSVQSEFGAERTDFSSDLQETKPETGSNKDANIAVSAEKEPIESKPPQSTSLAEDLVQSNSFETVEQEKKIASNDNAVASEVGAGVGETTFEAAQEKKLTPKSDVDLV